MERITRFRALVLLLVCALVLGIYATHMYSVQVAGNGDVVESSSTFTSYYTVKGVRGEIRDREGNALVGNRAGYNLTFNNFVLASSDDPNSHLLRLVQLCRELGIEYNETFPVTVTRPYEYTLAEQTSAQKGYFQSYLAAMEIDSDISATRLMRELRDYYSIPDDWSDEDVRRVIGLRYELRLRTEITNLPTYVFIEDVADETLNAIMELNIPGLDVEATTVREYATPYLAHVLGTVGAMNSEEWEELKDKGYSMDDYVGKDGLELALEEYLHGTDGQLVRTVDKNGNIISEYYSLLPQAGNNVELSISLDLQRVLEDSMATYFENLRNGALNDGSTGTDVKGLAGVVLDPRTGEILAMASYPTYDPATYRENYKELESDPDSPLINRVLYPYAPGSVYKMVPTIAAIDTGAITRYTKITTKGIYTKYDDVQPTCLIYSRRNGKNHGTIDVTEALSVSCNYFFYEVGDMLNINDMDAVAKALGLGEATGLELPESVGRRANPETKAELYTGSASGWYPADQILAAIGQSENRFTPLQLASYTATLANRGTRRACTLLNRVVSSDYTELVLEKQPEVLSTLDISAEAVDAYVTGMNNVTKVGTAYNYFVRWYQEHDIEVCAKTGTAEHGSGGSPHGSFICFAPADDPEIVVVIYGEKAGQGGYLGNIAIDVMDAYFAQIDASDIVTYENRAS